MAQKIESLRGMEDILPGEVEKWQWLEEKARIFFQGHGFKEIRTPILEYTDLFSRSIGEASDIVHKEMFSFEDRGGRNVTMRPEMTASVARAVIEKGLLSQAKSLRFYYIGPMFRAERPQAGRKRQFHQIGIEIINEVEGMADLDSITSLYRFLEFVGVKEPLVRLNDLGTVETQAKVAGELKQYFSSKAVELCKDCQWRLEKNVLRILDCKVNSCQPVIDNIPWEKLFSKSEEFEKLQQSLSANGIPFEIKRRLVRGLDYYNGPVFEVTAQGLGSQDALAGGGRYDRLYSELGGKPTPCTGFSIGMERLLSTLEFSHEDLNQLVAENVVYFAPVLNDDKFLKKNEAHQFMIQTWYDLSPLGIKSVMGDVSLKMENHLKNANKIGAKYVVILGPDEFAKQEWKLKDMNKRSEESVKWGSLFSKLRQVNV